MSIHLARSRAKIPGLGDHQLRVLQCRSLLRRTAGKFGTVKLEQRADSLLLFAFLPI